MKFSSKLLILSVFIGQALCAMDQRLESQKTMDALYQQQMNRLEARNCKSSALCVIRLFKELADKERGYLEMLQGDSTNPQTAVDNFNRAKLFIDKVVPKASIPTKSPSSTTPAKPVAPTFEM